MCVEGFTLGFNGIQWKLMPWESTVSASSGYCGNWLVATGNLLSLAVIVDNSPNLEGLLFAWVDGDVCWGSSLTSGVFKSFRASVAANWQTKGNSKETTGNLLSLAVFVDNSPNLEGVLYACVDGYVYWGSRSNSGCLTW